MDYTSRPSDPSLEYARQQAENYIAQLRAVLYLKDNYPEYGVAIRADDMRRIVWRVEAQS